MDFSRTYYRYNPYKFFHHLFFLDQNSNKFNKDSLFSYIKFRDRFIIP